MKVKRHFYTGCTGEVIVDAAAEDTIVLEVKAHAPRRRNEGIDVNVDAAIGSLSVAGVVEISASVAMTDAEALALARRLEKAVRNE